jgi:hypothetical protein
MSAVQIQGNASGTGTLTIAAPNTNTNQTLTLPDLTGTLIAGTSGVAGEANGGTGTTTGYYGFKNRIINGGMVIDQRNAGASVTVNTGNQTFSVDRWWGQATASSGVFTLTQSSTVPAGFTKSMLVTVTTADASLASSDLYDISQFIEGFNVADLGWGTASAATVTLSFWVRSSVTGTFGGAFVNSAANRSYPFTYSISAANTWEQKTITVVGDTSGTWVTDSGIGLRVYFGFGLGSTYSGTAGAWAGAFYISATGATNLMATNGATFYITGVQLEKGSTATSFDFRSYGTELALCQRYLPAWRASSATDPIASGNQFSTTLPISMFVLPVETRVAPTGFIASNAAHFQWNGGNGSAAISSFTFSTASTKFAVMNATMTANGAIGYAGTLYMVNASGYIYLTGCEL